MSIFGNLSNEGLEQAQDNLGGGKSFTFETDSYDTTIKLAYAGKSPGGAQFVHVVFDMPDGRQYSEDFYVTNKQGQNFYMAKDKDGKETGKKRALPGFEVMNDICMATLEKELKDMSTEEKTVNIYDFDAKKELPKSVPVLTALIDQPVTIGLVLQLENKNVKDASGNYVPTAETRKTNTVDKVFHTETKMTMVEATQGLEKQFHAAWVERNKGVTRDKRKIKDGEGGQAGRPGASGGAPQASSGGAAPRTSLFGNKG